ncbi:CAP domain-containing protein [Fructobacillus sp. M1-13]|uniref:LysM peptidoglycan-binding domain-containing protein n=1 Tax=Fructobacillus papyriferae TaxID=2713171 RepID=A0ABS5QPX9_9LACO|nr:CAP domain-containing protein [Fructobacillus papyriferae]MBS9335233.1 LysM peptidoglycan-binding domain-containing protein [Fructobacillus papyriferae]MCD2159098.1 CAP domain-containing protein [Fructobacillus papyriferae]
MKNNVTKTILAALASATAFAAAGAQASANELTIQDGDTLSQIAEDNNTTVEELVAKNNIANADLIIAGSTISTDGVANVDASATATASTDEGVQATSSDDDTNQAAVTNVNTQAEAATTSSVDYSSYAAGAGSMQTVVNAMNAKRAAAGLAPVSYDASLASTAYSRAQNAVANGGLPSGHFQQVAGPEVVAIGWAPSAVVDAWYNETGMVAAPAHHNWLMNASFTRVGFAMVGDTIVGIAG